MRFIVFLLFFQVWYMGCIWVFYEEFIDSKQLIQMYYKYLFQLQLQQIYFYIRIKQQHKQLFNFFQIQTKMDLLTQLTKTKDQGNDLFKQKNFASSIQKFTQCITTIQSQSDKQYLSKQTQIGKLYIVCLINSALACINIKSVQKYREAINHCNKALAIDPENVKGLYRRGLARKEMGEILERENGVGMQGLLGIYEDAGKDFQKLCLVDKGNQLATKNLSLVTKDIYRVTVGRGQKPNLGRQNTGQDPKSSQSDEKQLQKQTHNPKTQKKYKDMQKIMKQYKVQQVTGYVQEKVRSQYLTNPLPQLRSQLQKAIRTLQKSQDAYIQFVYRLNQQYLNKIQPTFDILANLVNIITKKGINQKQKSRDVLKAIQKQKSWKLLWKSYTAKEKENLKEKFKQFGIAEQGYIA